MDRENVDWNAIKTEYITTDTSYRRLGKKYGIDYKMIGRHASRDGWVKAKEEWCAQTLNKVLNKAGDDEADRLSSVRRAAVRMAGILEKATEDKSCFFNNEGKLSSRAMQQAVSALKDLTAILRGLYDLPTGAEKQAQQLARERMELERQRFELERMRATGGDRDDDLYGVVEIGEVLAGDPQDKDAGEN